MMLLEINNYCSSPAIANIMLLLKNIFNVVMIVAPILAIISLTITFTKIAANPENKKLFKNIKNSLIALILVFLIPVIVNASMSLLDDSTDISKCWNNVKNVSTTTTYIDPHKDKKKSVLSSPDDYEKGENKAKLSKSQNTKVVFIGNSKTYVHDIPGIFKNIASSGGYSVTTTSIVEGGKTLAWHASTNASRLKSNYDIAVFQEQTDSMQSDLNGYKAGAINVANLLRSANSNISIYVRECWSYAGVDSRTHKAVQTNAASVAQAINGTVIKDGQAWDRYGNNNGLYQDDTHQSKKGAYLSAICIYKALTNDDPTRITYYGSIDNATAKKFQEIARDIC